MPSEWARLTGPESMVSNQTKLFILAFAFSAFASLAQDASFCNLVRRPDAISIVTETGKTELLPTDPEHWSGGRVTLTTRIRRGGLELVLQAPQVAVKHLLVCWKAQLPPSWKYLGDAWERAYGDLEWKPLDPKRVMPWYFLTSDGQLTHGYGVRTGASALCHWTAEAGNITLHADVRCGGVGVQLGRRQLAICTVLCRPGYAGETPFAAAQAFCRQMCPQPRLPRQPVYGFNDWYCSYGHDTAEDFLKNTAYVVSLSPPGPNRPFAVVDDGWQIKEDRGGTNGPGPWNRTNPKFSPTLTMPEFVKCVRQAGARPGVWVRPLQASPDQPPAWRLARDPRHVLDPSVPEVRAYVRQTIRRLRGWGFELIKHDFTTDEIAGRWGFQMQGEMLADGWAFADRSRTTAEIIRQLYLDIREAAGRNVVIIGCNTVGHLAAGIFELQRIGDDTSGQEWARTRKMGVNCLAFRAALSAAARPQPLGEPLDWLDARTPAHWRLGTETVTFSW